MHSCNGAVPTLLHHSEQRLRRRASGTGGERLHAEHWGELPRCVFRGSTQYPETAAPEIQQLFNVIALTPTPMTLQEITFYACPILFTAGGYVLGRIITERQVRNRRRGKWVIGYHIFKA